MAGAPDESATQPDGRTNGAGAGAAVVVDGAGALPRRPPAKASSGKYADADITIRASGRTAGGNAEHGIIVGNGQMGKSTAAHGLFRGLRNLVIIDFAQKGQYDKLGHVTANPDDILRHPVVIFRVPRGAVVNPDLKGFTDPWSRALYNINTVRAQSGVTVVHDEARRTLPSVNPHPFAAEMVDLGAGRGIGVWVLLQGFSRVYSPVFDNATHWLFFRMASAQQRGTLGASLEVTLPEVAKLDPMTFMYYRQGRQDATGPHHVKQLGPRPPA